MPRVSPVSPEEVHEAALKLLLKGARPTTKLIQGMIGDGAESTVRRYLDGWWSTLGERLRQSDAEAGIAEQEQAIKEAEGAISAADNRTLSPREQQQVEMLKSTITDALQQIEFVRAKLSELLEPGEAPPATSHSPEAAALTADTTPDAGVTHGGLQAEAAQHQEPDAFDVADIEFSQDDLAEIARLAEEELAASAGAGNAKADATQEALNEEGGPELSEEELDDLDNQAASRFGGTQKGAWATSRTQGAPAESLRAASDQDLDELDLTSDDLDDVESLAASQSAAAPPAASDSSAANQTADDQGGRGEALEDDDLETLGNDGAPPREVNAALRAGMRRQFR